MPWNKTLNYTSTNLRNLNWRISNTTELAQITSELHTYFLYKGDPPDMSERNMTTLHTSNKICSEMLQLHDYILGRKKICIQHISRWLYRTSPWTFIALWMMCEEVNYDVGQYNIPVDPFLLGEPTNILYRSTVQQR